MISIPLRFRRVSIINRVPVSRFQLAASKANPTRKLISGCFFRKTVQWSSVDVNCRAPWVSIFRVKRRGRLCAFINEF